ncbi:uncharacterized protein LOC114321114 [Camellia sinensis]|uniref:uncharacterized protein LOC114321114 n=1 Tax=Camellia sinensis TaxID=4442 RepID=UPI001036605E|nr:uncharacterized protein LOC114321114 [Camellia sinensis]
MVIELLEGIHFVSSVEAISLGAQAGIHPWIIYDIISNAAGNSCLLICYSSGAAVMLLLLLRCCGDAAVMVFVTMRCCYVIVGCLLVLLMFGRVQDFLSNL